jgi:hypothetical protein
MNTRRSTPLALLLLVGCLLCGARAWAQSTSIFSTGLKAPSRIVITPRGNLLVAESGQGPNTGRLSLIDRKTGQRRTILDGLPAGPPPEGGTSGPSGLALRGSTLFMTIGAGDGVLAGPFPGTEKANPNPSSPIISSVLAIHASANVENSSAGFALTPADHATLKNNPVTLSNGQGDTLRVELIVDFPNFQPEPRPDFSDNVRASNPFGVAVSGNLLYVVDASLNKLVTVGVESGNTATLATFAQVPNPLFPLGPPNVDAVPDSVRLYGDQLLVTYLTGFPFAPGASRVRRVDQVTGAQSDFINNLNSAIDVLPVRHSGNKEQFYVLEFSTNQRQNAPGRLLLFESPTAAPVVIAAPLISPTGMARDRQTGDIFIAEMFTGRIMRVDAARLFVRQHYRDFLLREPDADGWAFWQGQITQCGDDASCRERKRVDVSRAFFYSNEFIGAHPELRAELRGTAEYNRAFVRESYLAYLQRTCNPEVCDPDGFNFWVNKINSHLPSTDHDYNEMIRAFILSEEYRKRLALS